MTGEDRDALERRLAAVRRLRDDYQRALRTPILRWHPEGPTARAARCGIVRCDGEIATVQQQLDQLPLDLTHPHQRKAPPCESSD